MNCSSQRSGRHVLSQLKEATQSHLVEMSGKDPLKPTYFNNYNTNSCTPKSETLPGTTWIDDDDTVLIEIQIIMQNLVLPYFEKLSTEIVL